MTIFTTPLKAAHVAGEKVKASDQNAVETAINELATALKPLIVLTPGPSASVTLSATPAVGSVTLSWTAVPAASATSIQIQRIGADAAGTPIAAVTLATSASSYKFDNLVAGTVYTFTFQALPSGSLQSITQAPLTPTVAAQTTISTTASDGTVAVSWTPVPGATGYLVGRTGTDATGYGPYETTDPADSTSRTFLSLVNGTTYTFYVEPQPSTSNGGTFTRQSKTATPVAAATPAGQTKVTLSAITGSTVTMGWTLVSGATGYLVGRVNLNNSADVYETTDGAAVTSRVFDQLTAGVPYSFYVTPVPGGTKVAATATPVGTVVTAPTAPTGSGTQWISGMSGYVTTADRAAQDAFRGEVGHFSRRWFTGDRLSYMYLVRDDYPSSYVGYSDLALAGPGTPVNGASIANDTWAGAASGSNDAVWRAQCQAIHQYWPANIKGFTLSMAHELNGDWYVWSVKGQYASFIAAWRRYYAIVQQELVAKGRNVKVCINYANDHPGVSQMWPGDAYVDLVGVDIYDMFKPTASGNILTQAEWDAFYNSTNSDGSPMGPGAWTTFAINHGKPIFYPEWGITASTAYNRDNPFWVQKMYDYFKSIAPIDPLNPAAGKLAGEIYFNPPNWPSTLWPASAMVAPNSKPQSAAKYASLAWPTAF